jgi:hypothetical protein
MPVVVSVILMFEKLTSDKVRVWPLGHEKDPGPGGKRVRLAVIWPFLPDVNVPVAVTGPETVTLLEASGHCPPLFTQL